MLVKGAPDQCYLTILSSLQSHPSELKGISIPSHLACFQQLIQANNKDIIPAPHPIMTRASNAECVSIKNIKTMSMEQWIMSQAYILLKLLPHLPVSNESTIPLPLTLALTSDSSCTHFCCRLLVFSVWAFKLPSTRPHLSRLSWTSCWDWDTKKNQNVNIIKT